MTSELVNPCVRPGVELRCAGDEGGDVAPCDLVQHHRGHVGADSTLAADGSERSALGLHAVVLRIHVRVVEVGELRSRGLGGAQRIAQHRRELGLPEMRVRGETGGEVHDLTAGHRLRGLLGVEQIGAHNPVCGVHLAWVPADEPKVVGV